MGLRELPISDVEEEFLTENHETIRDERATLLATALFNVTPTPFFVLGALLVLSGTVSATLKE